MADGSIVDLIESEPKKGSQGFMDLAAKAPMPKDKSFFNDLKDYAKTVLKGAVEGLGRLGTTMGPLMDERRRSREEILAEQTEKLDELLPTDEGFAQRSLRRGLRMAPEMAAFPIGGHIQAVARSGLAGIAGEGAKALGAPEWLQTAAELGAFIGPDITKKLLESGSNAELIKKAKEFGLTDEQITPLIQSDFKQKWLAKLTPKRGSTQKALGETKAGLGQLRDTIKMSPEAAHEIGEKANGQLINELRSKLSEMPREVQSLIKGDLDDLLKNKITGRSLINFWADINSKYGAGGEQLGILKDPIKNALASISPSVAQDFEFSNELFKKYYPISSKLKPNLINDIVRAGEILGLGGSMLGALTMGVMGPLYGFIGEKIARKVAQQMLINPRFQQLSQKAVSALNENKFGIFKKIADQFADEIKKYSPKAGKELENISEEDLKNLFSHQE